MLCLCVCCVCVFVCVCVCVCVYVCVCVGGVGMAALLSVLFEECHRRVLYRRVSIVGGMAAVWLGVFTMWKCFTL